MKKPFLLPHFRSIQMPRLVDFRPVESPAKNSTWISERLPRYSVPPSPSFSTMALIRSNMMECAGTFLPTIISNTPLSCLYGTRATALKILAATNASSEYLNGRPTLPSLRSSTLYSWSSSMSST